MDEYIKEYGLDGYSVAIYDENTYRATAGMHPFADKEIVLWPKGLHADNHGVTLDATRAVLESAQGIKKGDIALTKNSPTDF